MDNKTFAKELEKRTRRFAVNILRLSSQLPDHTEGKVVRYQIVKCGTSIGANYREANRARSRADFRNKAKICTGEASETLYWLEIISDLKWLPEEKLIPIRKECDELVSLFTTITKNSSL